MARYYGPADYDPEEVPTWNGITQSINEYIGYHGYYPYRMPEGYRVPPELMQREYTSDLLLQEAAAAANQQIEEVADTLNMGVDATMETMNEGVDAAVEGANEALSAGADEITNVANDAFEAVMDTRHGIRNDSAEADREEEVYSTYHGTISDAQEREVTGPVSAINKGIDDALQQEQDEPGMLEVMGNASWRVAGGLTAWAESVQRDHYSTATHDGTPFGKETYTGLPDGREVRSEGDAFYSTRHITAVTDGQDESGLLVEEPVMAITESTSDSMQDAFSRNSPRQMYQLDEYRQMAEKEMTMPKAKTPEEIAVLQQQRFQMSLELLQNIDFGTMFQRDLGMGE